MPMTNRLPLCFALAASLGGCGSAQPGPAGPAGPSGNPGEQGVPGPVEPELTSLLPNGSFLARTARMQISGSGTHFTNASTVDFGDPAITVSNISAGGDNNLNLTVQVGANARLGPHDVTVTTGNETAQLTGVFPVAASLQAEPVTQQPMVPQGGLYSYNLRNLDYRENPLNFGTPMVTGFSIVSPQGGSETRTEGVALIDALTPAGLLSLSITQKSPFGEDILYTTSPMDPSLARVTARTPVTLTSGTARAGDSLPANMATNLYRLTTAAANQLLIISYSALGTALNTGMPQLMTAIAPASGKFSQGSILPPAFNMTARTAVTLTELPTAGDYFLSTYTRDFVGGASGFTYTITPRTSTLTTVTNPEPGAETPATPSLRVNSLTGAVKAVDGKVSLSSDMDYVVFTAATTGTALLQISMPPFPPGVFAPGLSVNAYNDATCTMMIASGSASPEQPSTLEIPVTAGSTYCVSLSAFFVPMGLEMAYKVLLAP